FAHGRHHWLAKRGSTTAVLALVTDDERDIADKTLRLIPATVPVVRIDIPHSGLYASLTALIQALHIVGIAGEVRNIDPGRPSVPLFGRKLYNLQAFGVSRVSDHALSARETVAIERKTGMSVETLTMRGEYDFWRDAYRNFCA